MAIGAVYFEPGFRRAGWYALFGGGIALVFLVHPLTSIFLLLSLSVKVVMAPGHWLRNGMEAVWVPIIGIAAGFLWPYFSVTELVSDTALGGEFFGGFDVFLQSSD